MTTPRPVQHAVSDEQVQSLWQQRSDLESFLSEMRGRGAWQIESIRAVRMLAGVSLAEAKEMVHFSHTWQDTRDASEALHDLLFEQLDDMQREDNRVTSDRLAS